MDKPTSVMIVLCIVFVFAVGCSGTTSPNANQAAPATAAKSTSKPTAPTASPAAPATATKSNLKPTAPSANPQPTAPTGTGNAPATEASPTGEPTETDVPTLATTDCAIIRQEDATALLGGQADQTSNDATQSDQVDFSPEQVSVIESDCSYETSANSVTYTVYKPDRSKPEDLAKLWNDDKNSDPSTVRAVPGVGDDAYYRDGDLHVKKGSYYVTITVQMADTNTDTDAGVTQLIGQEKAFALKALPRIP